MVWLNSRDYQKQEYMELRLNSPLYENIRLDFNPLKISDVSGQEPSWKDWHCYRNPLRVYSPDFDILVSYFNQVYPIIVIHNIEVDLINFSKEEKEFLNTFIDWITDALQHTSVIVVEGNL